MEFKVEIQGLDRIDKATQRAGAVQSADEPPHNGKRIAALMEQALNEAKRRGIVREHGD